MLLLIETRATDLARYSIRHATGFCTGRAAVQSRAYTSMPSRGISMAANDSGDKSGTEQIGLVTFCVCGAAVAIVFFGGANWPTAAAICGLAGMGLGMAFLILKK
ncbi:MAG: hypothetical protein HY290_12580 [Planctomycetia bacterium]|nr:hypothetical protein [Planctomycetia bacterium]